MACRSVSPLCRFCGRCICEMICKSCQLYSSSTGTMHDHATSHGAAGVWPRLQMTQLMLASCCMCAPGSAQPLSALQGPLTQRLEQNVAREHHRHHAQAWLRCYGTETGQ